MKVKADGGLLQIAKTREVRSDDLGTRSHVIQKLFWPNKKGTGNTIDITRLGTMTSDEKFPQN